MRRAKAEWSDPMPRGARIAGWVYFPIHVAVLPLTIGALLMAVLGELPSDVTCNVLYYLIGLVFTLAVMWRFLHRSFDTMAGSILRCIGMMLAAYGIDVLLSLVLQLGTGLIGELPVPNNDAVTGLAKVDYKRMIAVAVLMAPLVEECLFRGVVFGTIRPHSRFWAYAVSIALFSLYHVWQYVVMYGDPKLLLSALAYVPVSAALTFCYEQTRSIWPPVFSTCASTRSRSRYSPGERRKDPPLSDSGKRRIFMLRFFRTRKTDSPRRHARRAARRTRSAMRGLRPDPGKTRPSGAQRRFL